MEAISDMTIGELIRGVAGILLVLSGFVELVPIKVNPWSSILNWIGKKLNGDLSSRVQKLEDSLIELKEETKEQQAINARVRILRFGDELRLNIKHTKEHFEQTLKDIDFYNNYCDLHKDFKNSITVITTEHIQETYRECRDKNSFLR